MQSKSLRDKVLMDKLKKVLKSFFVVDRVNKHRAIVGPSPRVAYVVSFRIERIVSPTEYSLVAESRCC